MNIGVIFAGGSGTRMHTKDIPKQFLMVHGKPIIVHVPSRENSRLAQAPQSFWLNEILEIDRRAISEGNINMIDSCSMMRYYGKRLSVVIGPSENIKITTPDDFYTFRALYDARENQQLI